MDASRTYLDWLDEHQVRISRKHLGIDGLMVWWVSVKELESFEGLKRTKRKLVDEGLYIA
jgi:hypothetical protein